MDLSEFNVTPRRILLHDPRHGGAIHDMNSDRLVESNFLAVPSASKLLDQYALFRQALDQHVETIALQDIVGDDPVFQAQSHANPNLIFTRDSSITLPWEPGLFIPARLALPSRAMEGPLVARALERLGLRRAFEFSDDEYVEGGDVLPAMDGGKRILLVGFGVRTTKAAAIRLALELIPHHVDEIIGLSHDPDLLHLDTGFTVLPNRVMFVAGGMFHSGFVIDKNRNLSRVDPIAHAEALGFTIIRCDKADAIAHERCNLLPLGSGRYLAFDMPDAIREELEAAAGIAIACFPGHEIAKAAGGVHCLTRPLYM